MKFIVAATAILNLLFLFILVKCPISSGSPLYCCKISFIHVNRRPSYCCLCHLGFYFCSFWSNVPFPVAALYITAKFHSFIGGWIIAVCAKIQDGGRRHIKLYIFVMLDQPRSPFVHLKFFFKFRVDRVRTFRDIAIQKFWKFGSKCLFRPPKSCFWGVLTRKHYFLLSRPPKGPTLHGNTRFEP